MKINKICNIFFSPTDSTKAVLNFLHKDCALKVEDVDLTPFDSENLTREFASEDLVYIAVPSYAGRVPSTFVSRLKYITANNTPAVLIVTFGNRAYEDTLLELKDLAISCGFKVIAGACIVTQHSIIPEFGANRPDEKDKAELQVFVKAVNKKIKAFDLDGFAEIKVAGNYPYKNVNPVSLAPEFNQSACIGCGICKLSCPTNAIDEEFNCVKEKCISCLRCIKVCPMNCRYVDSSLLEKLKAHLKPLCQTRKSNEFFI